MKTKALKAEIERLECELNDERIYRTAACRAHAILSVGIKKALRLEHWPDFYKLYGGDGLFAEGVVRLLNEELDKLRDNCTKDKHAKPKSRR